ncbi:MAG: rhomboid family intramembrane serine protease [Desulfobacteraceae bacterium]|jgi:membrane associated rhomboid family serine protease
MFILPLSGKLSRRNPPYVTIGIILLNVMIFFIFQSGDGEKYAHAMDYYFKSGLAKIEVKKYLEYSALLAGDNNALSQNIEKSISDEKELDLHYQKMLGDDTFIIKLRSEQIIVTDDSIYPEWKKLRTEYDTLLSGVVFLRYGFTPAFINIPSVIVHMFLHGDFMHLLGNMIFLWLVGCVLELGCGRKMYTIIYLIGGLCSAGLFYLIYMNSTVPCIGASGAISGLIGAYTVLYGKRKIKAFYSLGFYFNYALVPAIILLPVWVGNELFQLLFGGISNVAYVAHIGGLLSGAGLGYLDLKFTDTVNDKVFDEDPRDKIPGILEEALQLVGTLDMDKARPLVEQILEIDPQNREALILLFNIDKYNPGRDRFQLTSNRLLTHLSSDKAAFDLLYKYYSEYCSISKPPRLNLSLLSGIASVFAVHQYLKESEQIMALLIRNKPGYEKIPHGILLLGRAYLKQGISDKAKKCLEIICKKYPGSVESKTAKILLEKC